MICTPSLLVHRRNRATSQQGQRGMTLLVGLILLMMLTVVSTIGFRNTTMSERMTGNSVDRNVSFQSAESAGKEALTLIEAGGFSAGTTGHYGAPISQGGTTSFWTKGDGSAAFSSLADCTASTTTAFRWIYTTTSGKVNCAARVSTLYANNASNAQYVIELLTQVVSGTNTVSTYRVTSRSTGGSGNADVVLQINYVRSAATP